MKNVLNKLRNLLQVNTTVVLAVSGGPDSIFLLNAVNELKKELSLEIIVAHVNHNLRSESLEEAHFVEELCHSLDIKYEYMEILEYDNDNIESIARYKRYAFFKEIVLKYKAKYLMTAHHGDDLMETILMRIVRGSSIKGYGGFREIVDMGEFKIIRPLINITKKEITNYLDDNNIKYCVDMSNYSLKYTRNRYRMKLLPFLKNENKLVHKKFLKFSNEIYRVSDFLDKYIFKLVNELKDDKGINIDKLLDLDDFLIKKVIEYELSKVYVNDLFLVGDKNTELIIKLLRSDISNGKINLPNNNLAIKEYNYFKIVNNKDKNEYEIVIDDYVKTNYGVIKRVKSSNIKSNYVIRLNSKDIKMPIKVRNRRNGDKMQVKNLKGSKKIKDIFIDEKISSSKRDDYPIVIDSENEILWVPGVKKSKFDVESFGIYDIILTYEEE